MNSSRQLHELQKVDLEIDARNERVAELTGQVDQSEDLLQAQEAIAAAEARVQDLEKRQRDLEWAVADLRARIEPLEKKLYGGTVRLPKELANLQEEVNHLKAGYRRVEDQQLEVMVELDTAQTDLAAQRQSVAQVDAAWHVSQDDAHAELIRLRDELTGREARRRALANGIAPADLTLYEHLRPPRRGRAVALVVRGMCEGCRVALPVSDLTRLRTSERPMQCPNCGRILVPA